MKKVFKFVAAIAVMSVLVSSCGNKKTSAAAAGDGVDSTEVVVDSVAVDTTQVAK